MLTRAARSLLELSALSMVLACRSLASCSWRTDRIGVMGILLCPERRQTVFCSIDDRNFGGLAAASASVSERRMRERVLVGSLLRGAKLLAHGCADVRILQFSDRGSGER